MDLFKFTFITLVSLILSALPSFTLAAQKPVETLGGKWQVTLRYKDLGEMRTTLHFRFSGEASFRASSHRDAVKNLIGGFKARMGKMFSKKTLLRSGAFCNITQGEARQSGNKVVFSGMLDFTVAPAARCEGMVENGELSIPIQNAQGKTVGIIQGSRVEADVEIDDYAAIVQTLLESYEAKIYDRRVLNTAAWKSFARKMKAAGAKAKDDLDLVFGFFTHAKKLPFSHKALFRTEMPDAGKNQISHRFAFRPGQVSFEEKTPQTALLRIKSFFCPGRDVDSVMQIVLSKNYQNLIIDIRGNSGGALEGGITLAQYLVPEETPTGVYLTQKWFNQHSAPPSTSQLASMPAFTKPDVLAFLDALDENGYVVLKARPGAQRFTGKVFLLTDRRSASACEPLTWNFKHSGRATVVGEPTAGAMLSASNYPLRSGFTAIIPNADFYTPTGERLDKVGVQPNILVKSADALQYVLDNLIKN